MEAASSSGTCDDLQLTRPHILEDLNLHDQLLKLRERVEIAWMHCAGCARPSRYLSETNL